MSPRSLWRRTFRLLSLPAFCIRQLLRCTQTQQLPIISIQEIENIDGKCCANNRSNYVYPRNTIHVAGGDHFRNIPPKTYSGIKTPPVVGPMAADMAKSVNPMASP